MMPKLWWWILLLSITFFDAVVFTDPIFQAYTGKTFGRSSREPKYNIEFHPADAPFHSDDDRESLVMANGNGEKYMCFLPKPEKRKSENLNRNSSSMIMGMERRLKQRTPDELLESLKDRCLLREEGWWSYEFCYQKQLRQIHVEGEKVVQEFVLGVYDASATESYHQNLSDISTLKDPRSKDASQRYHAHQYTNGTMCDLTNQPRETEIRFVCSEPKGRISSITEISTCKYALTVYCPTLCKHPLFQEEKQVWHTIHCSAVGKQGKDDGVKEKRAEDEKIAMITALLPNFNLDGYAI